MPRKPGAVYYNCSSYLDRALFDIDSIVNNAKLNLKDVDFDTFVGTGLSGALVVPVVAREMDKFFAIVRKDNDSSHAWVTVEGEIGKRWVFLDDLVATGQTRGKVMKAVAGLTLSKWNRETEIFDITKVGDLTQYVGEYLYEDRRYRPADYTEHW